MRNPLCLYLCLFLCASTAIAQNYRCDWSVVDIGGGSMSTTGYRSDATVGQTAAGQMTGTAYQAFIGFWQIDTVHVGIVEDQHWSVTEPLRTALYTPYPNPSPLSRLPKVHYSLATEAQVLIQLFDLSGRKARTLVNARQKPGRYSVGVWDLGVGISRLGSGIYFLKMTAGEYSATRKLVLQ